MNQNHYKKHTDDIESNTISLVLWQSDENQAHSAYGEVMHDRFDQGLGEVSVTDISLPMIVRVLTNLLCKYN